MNTNRVILEHWHSRMALPTILNELGLNKLGVEVGTQRGVFAAHILSQWPGSLTVVDPWRHIPGYQDTGNVSDMAQENIRLEALARLDEAGRGRWLEMRMPSLLAATRHGPQANFDFVYLDAMHDYDSVKADINSWWPHVRSGGILAGHDFIVDGWHLDDEPKQLAFEGHGTLFGVSKAVHEFTAELRLPLYVTSPETDAGYQSWLVVKP